MHACLGYTFLCIIILVILGRVKGNVYTNQASSCMLSTRSGMSSSLVVIMMSGKSEEDVTEVHLLVVMHCGTLWCWLWQIHPEDWGALMIGVGILKICLIRSFMDAQVSVWNWIFRPYFIIQWCCWEVFFKGRCIINPCNILQISVGLLQVLCVHAVLVTMLWWWRSCTSVGWTTSVSIGMLWSYRTLIIRTGEY